MVNQGLGKTLNREFSKTINEIHKSFLNGFNKGYGLDVDSYDAQMENALANYENTMETNDAPNVELWRERGQDLIETKRRDLEDKHPKAFVSPEFVDEPSDFDELDPTSEVDDRAFSGEENRGGYITINEQDIPIMDNDDIRLYKSMGYVRRSTEFPSEAELIDYAFDIPYIKGIELVYRGGFFEGYVVWIEYD